MKGFFPFCLPRCNELLLKRTGEAESEAHMKEFAAIFMVISLVLFLFGVLVIGYLIMEGASITTQNGGLSNMTVLGILGFLGSISGSGVSIAICQIDR